MAALGGCVKGAPCVARPVDPELFARVRGFASRPSVPRLTYSPPGTRTTLHPELTMCPDVQAMSEPVASPGGCAKGAPCVTRHVDPGMFARIRGFASPPDIIIHPWHAPASPPPFWVVCTGVESMSEPRVRRTVVQQVRCALPILLVPRCFYISVFLPLRPRSPTYPRYPPTEAHASPHTSGCVQMPRR